MSDIILETKLVSEITGTFYVPSYQRGYRWGEDEVLRLLNDVYQNGNKNYCLQPVVVRRTEDDFELIDGQQRLTTLYLIYKYMKNVNPFFDDPAFNLIYETRNNSEEFLQSIDVSRRDENIDFWFIANAYEAIKKWFEEDMQIRVLHVYEYFKEDVKIIWYEVGEAEDAIALFTRLNIGKIPLTSAELVKSMFLSRDNNENMLRERQEEISLQWDNIEKELHNDGLWYFLTNNVSQQYQTRIDLVLDLISGKEPGNKEKYYTFFFFDNRKSEISLKDLWQEILHTFLILKDWYGNHELYHKIGYLIASKHMKLAEVFNVSKGKTKREFISELNRLIKDSIKIKKNYADLSYDNAGDYAQISRLLLLFNVESVRTNGEQSQWFPFDKFKYHDKDKVSWSLEHIHAQQSEGMKTQNEWLEWLRLHIPSVKSLGVENEGLLKEMEKIVAAQKVERKTFMELQNKVIDLLSVRGNSEYVHKLSNLALLNCSDNAALSNSTFDVKRNEIIEMDKKGAFIPFCTKMAFLKYYTPSEENQIHFWGEPDRIAYISNINRVLKPYLNEEIEIEKEIQVKEESKL